MLGFSYVGVMLHNRVTAGKTIFFGDSLNWNSRG